MVLKAGIAYLLSSVVLRHTYGSFLLRFYTKREHIFSLLFQIFPDRKLDAWHAVEINWSTGPASCDAFTIDTSAKQKTSHSERKSIHGTRAKPRVQIVLFGELTRINTG